ncbi:MAG: S8 family serine peptidase [Acidimicrobiia bacterium]|nr:S8 family serine peptidase [Acidimicrobiia bacterium]
MLSVEPDRVVAALDVNPDDPLLAQQTGLTDAKFNLAWQELPSPKPDGSGVTVAVLDTGAQADHEDLLGQVLQGADLVTGTTTSPQGPTNYGRVDLNGHGTHVSGIVAAVDNTVGGLVGAPGARILPVRVLNSCGSGDMSNVAKGIEWAVDNGAEVVSMSLGGPCLSPPNAALDLAIDYAETNNVVVVAAAGNDANATPVCPGNAGSTPGATVLSVGATTSAPFARAPFSSFGPSVDLGAPGVQILSTYPASLSGGPYKRETGTSMAAPFVSAAAALVLRHCPGAPPARVRQIITTAAGPPIAGSGFGSGQLNADAAVTASCI